MMDNKLQKALQLTQQKKYARALPILKKINVKSPTFQSLECEALCLYNTKLYKLSLLRAEKALLLADSDETKLRTLKNITAAALEDDKNKAIWSMEAILKINGTVETADIRYNLCILLDEIQDYTNLYIHSSKLIGYEIYNSKGIAFKVKACLELNYETELDTLLDTVSQNANVIETTTLAYIAKNLEQKGSKRLVNWLNIVEKQIGHSEWIDKIKTPKYHQTAPEASKGDLSQNSRPVIDSDNKSINATINSLVIESIKLGAKFSNAITLSCKGDNLSITINKNEIASAKLMEIPLKAMPLLSDYKIELDSNNHFVCQPIKKMTNPSSAVIMEEIIKLYNQTNKVAFWQKYCPFISLSHLPDLLKFISLPLSSSTAVKRYFELLDINDIDSLTIESFFGSRRFSYKKSDLQNSNIKIKNEIEYGLLNIIDFLNHDLKAEPYKVEKGAVSISVPENLAKGNELLVRYNYDDPALTLLIYGFVDTSTPWVNSIPFTMTLPSGIKLDIGNHLGVVKELSQLPNTLKDCALYYPSQIKTIGDTIHLSKLVIPDILSASKLDRVLREILISQTNLTSGHIEQLEKNIGVIKHSLVEANLKFWLAAKSKIEEYKQQINDFTYQQLKQLIEVYLKHLDQFKNQIGRKGF